MEQAIHKVGKRKTAVARVYLKPGRGIIRVNDKEFESYFPRQILRMVVLQPFEVTNHVGRWDVRATVYGSGISSQASAVKHGISKALVEADPALRPVLKKAGFLTRDAREVERKKYGQSGARKRYQYSKR